MKAVTISQLYASLIASGEKWVENRTWETLYRGEIAIHAGRGTQYLTAKQLREYPIGCIVAVAHIIEVIHVPTMREYRDVCEENAVQFLPACRNLTAKEVCQALDHQHCEGPYGWVLAHVTPLKSPVPCPGALSLWEVPSHVSHAIREQLPN